jgi:hypothetical protein
VCTSIYLVLVTKDGAAAGDDNQYSTTGTPGTAVFPTARPTTTCSQIFYFVYDKVRQTI